MDRPCSKHELDGKYIENLVGKPEGKRPLGRPKRRWGLVLEWILGK